MTQKNEDIIDADAYPGCGKLEISAVGNVHCAPNLQNSIFDVDREQAKAAPRFEHHDDNNWVVC